MDRDVMSAKADRLIDHAAQLDVMWCQLKAHGLDWPAAYVLAMADEAMDRAHDLLDQLYPDPTA